MNGVFRLVFYGCEAVGAALTGVLIQQIGVQRTILCFAVLLVVLALAATRSRALRAARPLAEL